MKKAITFTLALILCLSLCACGGGADPKEQAPVGGDEQVSDNAEVQAPVEEEVQEPVENTTEDAPEVPDEGTSDTAIEVVEVTLPDTISTEFVEMTFNEVTIAEDIKYSVTTGFVTRTTGPEPVSGQKYICLTGTIKNTSKEPLPVYDYFIGEFNLDDYIYEVGANDCDILDGEGSTESSIDPLMEYVFRIYTAIPVSLADSHSASTFTFGFYDQFDNAELAMNRSFEEDPISLCPYQFKIILK